MVISMVISIIKYISISHTPVNQKILKKKTVQRELVKIWDIWENKNGGIHAHGNGRKWEKLIGHDAAHVSGLLSWNQH